MKKILILLISMAVLAISSSGCGTFSNMSQEDAYNVGYGAGTLLRNMIN